MAKRIFQPAIILLTIVVLAAALRIVALFYVGTYTFDDAFSVHFAQMDLGQMLDLIKDEVHPPLYFILLHFWLKIFGSGEIAPRVLALIFSLASLPLLYLLGKKIINRWVGLLASLMMALSYFEIFSGTQMRMYSLLTFFGLASLNLFWLVIVENKKNYWLLYILTNILLLYTHLGGIFGLITQGLWLIILKQKKSLPPNQTKKCLWAQVFILAVWSPWLIILFLPKLAAITGQGWYFNLASVKRQAAIGLYDYFFLLLENYWLRLISGVIIFSAPFLIWLWSDKKTLSSLQQKINPNWFLFSWVLPAFLASAISGVDLTRIFVVGYSGFYLIIAYLFYIALIKSKKTFWLLIILWFGLTAIHLGQNLTHSFSRWDLVNQWLQTNQRPGDQIILLSFTQLYQFQRYYQGTLPVQALSLFPYSTNDLDYQIIHYNWQDYQTNDYKINQLKTASQDTKRILLIHQLATKDQYFAGPVHQWLGQNDWQIATIFSPQAYYGPTVIGYQPKNQ